MKIVLSLTLNAAFAFTAFALNDETDVEYISALNYGADAALNVFLHDEEGNPVPNADVRCGFWLMTSKRSGAVYGKSDFEGTGPTGCVCL